MYRNDGNHVRHANPWLDPVPAEQIQIWHNTSERESFARGCSCPFVQRQGVDQHLMRVFGQDNQDHALSARCTVGCS